MPGNILAADHLQAPPQAGSPSTGVPLLDGEEITALLTRFLRLVHVMNPVLDCTTLMTYGRAVAELGPQWDAKTCLVASFLVVSPGLMQANRLDQLLAAALGAIARPFGPGAETPSSLAVPPRSRRTRRLAKRQSRTTNMPSAGSASWDGASRRASAISCRGHTCSTRFVRWRPGSPSSRHPLFIPCTSRAGRRRR